MSILGCLEIDVIVLVFGLFLIYQMFMKSVPELMNEKHTHNEDLVRGEPVGAENLPVRRRRSVEWDEWNEGDDSNSDNIVMRKRKRDKGKKEDKDIEQKEEEEEEKDTPKGKISVVAVFDSVEGGKNRNIGKCFETETEATLRETDNRLNKAVERVARLKKRLFDYHEDNDDDGGGGVCRQPCHRQHHHHHHHHRNYDNDTNYEKISRQLQPSSSPMETFRRGVKKMEIKLDDRVLLTLVPHRNKQ